MPGLPIQPHFKGYGRSERTHERAAAFNHMAQRVADHIHKLILEDPASMQVYSFGQIALTLGLDVDDVRAAISGGGYNGISFGVDAADRDLLRGLVKR